MKDDDQLREPMSKEKESEVRGAEESLTSTKSCVLAFSSELEASEKTSTSSFLGYEAENSEKSTASPASATLNTSPQISSPNRHVKAVAKSDSSKEARKLAAQTEATKMSTETQTPTTAGIPKITTASETPKTESPQPTIKLLKLDADAESSTQKSGSAESALQAESLEPATTPAETEPESGFLKQTTETPTTQTFKPKAAEKPQPTAESEKSITGTPTTPSPHPTKASKSTNQSNETAEAETTRLSEEAPKAVQKDEAQKTGTIPLVGTTTALKTTMESVKPSESLERVLTPTIVPPKMTESPTLKSPAQTTTATQSTAESVKPSVSPTPLAQMTALHQPTTESSKLLETLNPKLSAHTTALKQTESVKPVESPTPRPLAQMTIGQQPTTEVANLEELPSVLKATPESIKLVKSLAPKPSSETRGLKPTNESPKQVETPTKLAAVLKISATLSVLKARNESAKQADSPTLKPSTQVTVELEPTTEPAKLKESLTPKLSVQTTVELKLTPESTKLVESSTPKPTEQAKTGEQRTIELAKLVELPTPVPSLQSTVLQSTTDSAKMGERSAKDGNATTELIKQVTPKLQAGTTVNLKPKTESPKPIESVTKLMTPVLKISVTLSVLKTKNESAKLADSQTPKPSTQVTIELEPTTEPTKSTESPASKPSTQAVTEVKETTESLEPVKSPIPALGTTQLQPPTKPAKQAELTILKPLAQTEERPAAELSKSAESLTSNSVQAATDLKLVTEPAEPVEPQTPKPSAQAATDLKLATEPPEPVEKPTAKPPPQATKELQLTSEPAQQAESPILKTLLQRTIEQQRAAETAKLTKSPTTELNSITKLAEPAESLTLKPLARSTLGSQPVSPTISLKAANEPAKSTKAPEHELSRENTGRGNVTVEPIKPAEVKTPEPPTVGLKVTIAATKPVDGATPQPSAETKT